MVIIETLTLITLISVGAAALCLAGMRGAALLPYGLVSGAGIYLAVALLQLVTRLPTHPAVTLSACLVLGAACAVVVVRRRLLRGSQRSLLVAFPAVLLSVMALVWFFRWGRFVNWHGDSHFYVFQGGLLERGKYLEASWPYLFEARPLAVPALHAPSVIAGEYYLPSLTPMLTIALVAILAHAFIKGLRGAIPPQAIAVFGLGGLAFLLTTNRFVYHANYLNGHLMLGVAVVVVATSTWLVSRGRTECPAAHIFAAATTIVLGVLARPEGAVTLGLALAPALLAPSLPLRYKRMLLAALGAVMAAWFSLGVAISARVGEVASASTLVQALVGLGLLIFAWLVRPGWLDLPLGRSLGLAETGLWLAVAVLALRDPETLAKSVSATATNLLGAAKWGFSLVMLGVLVIGVLVTFSARHLVALRFPVTTFIPLVLLLAYLRGGAYRVGVFDSLSRMWIQVFPLAVFFVAAALASGRWRLTWMGLRSAPGSYDEESAPKRVAEPSGPLPRGGARSARR